MNKLKQKIQDGTINIPGIVIKIALIWFIITFLVLKSACQGICKRRTFHIGSN